MMIKPEHPVSFEEFATYIESGAREEQGDPGDHRLTSDDFTRVHPIKLGFSHKECSEWHWKQAADFNGGWASVWIYGPHEYQSRDKAKEANQRPDFMHPLGLRRISEQ